MRLELSAAKQTEFLKGNSFSSQVSRVFLGSGIRFFDQSCARYGICRKRDVRTRGSFGFLGHWDPLGAPKGGGKPINQAPAGDALIQLGSIFTPCIQQYNALSILRLSGVRLINP
jgi:hypothetical protein